MIRLPDHHVSLRKSNEFKQICNSIFDGTPISFVYFGLLGKDGKNACLINKTEWHQFYWSGKGFVNKINKRVREGVRLWAFESILTEQNHCARENFGIDNKLEIVKKRSDGTYEMLGFGGDPFDDSINSFYLENLEELKKLPLLLSENHKGLLDEILEENNRIMLYPELKHHNSDKVNSLKDILPNGFKEKFSLTDQEFKALRLLRTYIKSKQIACEMGVSESTVNTYMARIKSKMSCYSKRDVIRIAKSWAVF